MVFIITNAIEIHSKLYDHVHLHVRRMLEITSDTGFERLQIEYIRVENHRVFPQSAHHASLTADAVWVCSDRTRNQWRMLGARGAGILPVVLEMMARSSVAPDLKSKLTEPKNERE